MALAWLFQFRHIFYAFAVSMCCSQMSVVSQTIDDTSLSCLGRCGQVILLPCSCDTTCTVLNKCCEGFADHCPHVFTRAMEMFPHLMNVTVKCTEENFFMITSCPQNRELSQVSESKIDGNKSIDLLDIINNAPVGDVSTGFVFRNSDIYACNGAEQTKMAAFRIELEMETDYFPKFYTNLDKALNKKNVIYMPSEDVFPFLGKSVCYQSISTCQNRLVNVTEETVDKCENGTFAYVISPQRETYKNLYCLLCNTGQMENYYLVTTWKPERHSMKFSVIPSLTNAGTTVSFAVNTNLPSSPSSWNEIECNLPENGQSPESRTCDIKHCASDFQMRSDGQCKKLYNATIGIAGDGYDLSDAEERHLPDLISCLLLEYLDLDIYYMNPNLFHGCDDRLKRDIYFVNFGVALIYTSDTLFPISENSDVIKFSAIVKAFFRHRKRTHLHGQKDTCKIPSKICFNKSKDSNVTSGCRSMDHVARWSGCETLDQSKCQNFSSRHFKYLDNRRILDSRGVIVENTTTTLCLLSVRQTSDLELRLAQCLEESLYENDLKLIAEYMNSSCFSVFEINRATNTMLYDVSLWPLGGWLLYNVLLNEVRLI